MTAKRVTKHGIPIVNLKDFTHGNELAKALFIEDMGQGLEEFGFFVLEGHQIDSDVIYQGYDLAKKLFSLSVEEKTKYKSVGGQRGYTGFGQEHAKNYSLGDLKEFWHVGREDFENPNFKDVYLKNQWPDLEIPQFKPALSKLYAGLDSVAQQLLKALSQYLGLPVNLLPDMTQDGNTILRILHYPPLTSEQFVTGAVRAAAHEDINFITILCEATDSGLEILTRDGKWLPIEGEPGQMVVDSGDMLSRLTNDVIRSTTHRVVNPEGAKNGPRYSMPYFVHPRSDVSLEVLKECVSASSPVKYPPCTAGEFLHQRLKEIGLI